MANNYVLLERIELNATATSVTFDNIPQTGYTDLKIVASVRDSSSNNLCSMYFNGDTSSANYTNRYLLGDGSSASSGTNSSWLVAGIQEPSGNTANTFASGEFYIPNYTSSNQKSVSVDGVQENNATGAWAWMNASKWSGTAAITSVTLAGISASFVSGSTFSLYGIAKLGTTPAVAPKADGGNVIGTDGTYWYHTFRTNGTFTPQTNLVCDYLVVAGGGGGGSAGSAGGRGAGGGGAGGYRATFGSASGGGGALESALSLTTSTQYPVTIGAGGTVAANDGGANGTSTTFSTITSTGGGGGGGWNNPNTIAAKAGGSGGGAADGIVGNTNGGAGTTSQGYRGGNNGGFAGGTGGSGGGGAGGIAFDQPAGSQYISGTAGGVGLTTTIAGVSTTLAVGGDGGGTSGSVPGTAGTINTGNGGKGGSGGSGTVLGGIGGSGIVIIRYPVAS